ncbi:NAD-dependent epimerase/dehydratase family protein [Occultella gossypii]|uniref:NAD-dependent epimerase/dehydratase family protein n=1 Tax=Occultella gossypii TaxID=2800820 RepID=A0ABS7S9U6_9MICO|nr:NAD-dependent epimerase/dehydratase family protein [Occultella gossypii]MBZ2196434.1 NAD-dependent epimerase/dehydratase family protein [Occultella gossypii]
MDNVLTSADRVLVLGASGFVGSHLAPMFAGLGVEFVRFDLFEGPHDGAPTTIGDVRDVDALIEAMAGCTAVLNLAAAHHDFGISTATFESVNVGGARAVCAAMDHHGITNLCFYSSVAVYGEQDAPPSESATPAPVNDYGRSKLAAEAVYREWERSAPGRRALIIRPAVVFGPRNFANVYRLIHQIDRRRFLSAGDGANRKSMCYVTNVVDAIGHLWAAPPQVAAGQDEVYNYVDKPDLTSREVVSAVYAALGRREPGLRIPLAPALWAAKPFDLIAAATGRNLPITSARIHKLANAETSFLADRVAATGFEPSVTLPEGLEAMVRWYLDVGREATPVVHLPPAEVARRTDGTS